MTGMAGSFNANQFKPMYGFDKVMPGKYPFRISNTEIVPTKDQSGGMFVVTFQTPSGSIQDRYNLWNASPKAVEIAHSQLSALCHCVGVFQLDWPNEGAALRNAEGMIEVGFQKGQEPTPENPNGGYTEIKRIYDKNGNEPGKGPNTAPQAAQGAAWQPSPQANTGVGGAPMTQQTNGGWGAATPNPQPTAQPAPPNTAPAWQQNQQPQGNAPAGAPPWAK